MVFSPFGLDNKVIQFTRVETVINLIHVWWPVCCTTRLLPRRSYGIEVTKSHSRRSCLKIEEATPEVMSIYIIISPIDKGGKED